MAKDKLPPGLRRRIGRKGDVNYYLKLAGNSAELRLHGDLDSALAQWRSHGIDSSLRRISAVRVSNLLELFANFEIPVRAAIESKHCLYLIDQVSALIRFFREHGDPDFRAPVPTAAEYAKWRGPTCAYRAHREIGLLNHIYNWASLHIPARIGDSPWSGSSDDEVLQEGKLKELGAAMAFYRGESSGGDRVYEDDDAPRNGTVTGNAASATLSTHAADTSLTALRDHCAKQLKLDGRPDLSRALAKLSEPDVRRALALATTAALAGIAPHLILATQRVPRVAALRRLRSSPHEHIKSGKR